MKRVCMIPIHAGMARRLRRMARCRSVPIARIASMAIEEYLDLALRDIRRK